MFRVLFFFFGFGVMVGVNLLVLVGLVGKDVGFLIVF